MTLNEEGDIERMLFPSYLHCLPDIQTAADQAPQCFVCSHAVAFDLQGSSLGKAKVSQIQHQEQVLAKRKKRASNFK